jgi:GAF domain-containing protein
MEKRNKKRILIIDDEVNEFLESVKDNLGDDFDLDFCTNNKSAFEKLKKNPEEYIGIILDYVLDPLNEAIDKTILKIHNLYSKLPIIIMSGKDVSGSVKTFNKEGVIASIIKPIDFGELRHILKGIENGEAILWQMANETYNLLQPFNPAFTIVWKFYRKKQNFEIVSWAPGPNQLFNEKSILTRGKISWKEFYLNREPRLIQDIVRTFNPDAFQLWDIILEGGWKDLFSIPLFQEDKFLGFIDTYSGSEGFNFENYEMTFILKALSSFSTQASNVIKSKALSLNSSIIREINQDYSKSFSENDILESILAKGIELSESDYGWIYIMDHESGKLKRKCSKNINIKVLQNHLELNSDSVTGKSAQDGQLYYDPNTKEPKKNFPKFLKIKGYRINSIVAVPLKKGKISIGAMAFSSKYKEHFTDNDIELFLSLAAIATSSIEQAKLTKHMTIASNMAMENNSKNDLPKYIVNAVNDILYVDVNFWNLSTDPDKGDKYLKIIASSGKFKSNTVYQENMVCIENDTSSLIGKCMDSNKPIRLIKILSDKDIENGNPDEENVINNNLLNYRKELLDQKYNSLMIVPFVGKHNEKIGALSCYGTMQNAFSKEDEDFIKIFANQAALAFQQQKRIMAFEELAKVGENIKTNNSNILRLLKEIANIAEDVTKPIITYNQSRLNKTNFVVIYPYDLINQEYFDKNDIVCSKSHKLTKSFTEKPRKDLGIISYIMEKGVLIVDEIGHDIKKGKFRNTFDGSAIHNYEELEKIHKIFEEEGARNFIDDNNIQSFVGIPLKIKTASSGNPIDVGIIYFDYWYPHTFTNDELNVMQIFSNHVANIIYGNWKNKETESQKIEIESQNKELKAIFDSISSILEFTEEKETLESITTEAQKLIGVNSGAIYLFDHGKLKLKTSSGIREDILRHAEEIGINQGFVWDVFTQMKTIVVPDYSTYQNRVKGLEDKIKSIMGVPLIAKKKIFGVLIVFSDQQNKNFKKKEEQILERFAKQATLCLIKAQLQDELKAIYSSGIKINENKKINEIFNNILEELSNVIEFSCATIQQINNPSKVRELKGCKGDTWESRENPKLLQPINNDNLMKRVFGINKKPLVLSDAKTDGDWDSSISTEISKIESWVGVPLYFGDSPIGLMTLDHYTKNYYQESDIQKIQMFGNLVSNSLNLHRLFENIENFGSESVLIKKIDNRHFIIKGVDAQIYNFLKEKNILNEIGSGIKNFDERVIKVFGSSNHDEIRREGVELMKDLWYKERGFPDYSLIEKLAEIQGKGKLYDSYRDHVIHMLRVYLLGLYLFYGCKSLKKEILKEFNGDVNDFLLTWKIAALFHDIGYIFTSDKEGNPDDNCNQIINHINSINKLVFHFYCNSKGIKNSKEENKKVNRICADAISELESIENLADFKGKSLFDILEDIGIKVNLGPENNKNIEDYWNYLQKNITNHKETDKQYGKLFDHGIASALVLIQLYKSLENFIVQGINCLNKNVVVATEIHIFKKHMSDHLHDIESLYPLIEKAACAIALHNINVDDWDIDHLQKKTKLTIHHFELSLARSPFAFFLALVDRLQDWDRPRSVIPARESYTESSDDINIKFDSEKDQIVITFLNDRLNCQKGSKFSKLVEDMVGNSDAKRKRNGYMKKEDIEKLLKEGVKSI